MRAHLLIYMYPRVRENVHYSLVYNAGASSSEYRLIKVLQFQSLYELFSKIGNIPKQDILVKFEIH